jgi:hypothetical protein
VTESTDLQKQHYVSLRVKMTENVKQAAPKLAQCDEVALFCGTAAVFLTTDQGFERQPVDARDVSPRLPVQPKLKPGRSDCSMRVRMFQENGEGIKLQRNRDLEPTT